MDRASALLRHQAAVVLIATVLGVGLAARLGWWQLDRAAQKIALQRSLEERAALPELPATALARTEAEAQAQQHRRIRLHGRWLDRATVYLDNRQMNGRPGFFVVTPLLLPETGQAVLVQRGWAPRDFTDRWRVPALPPSPAEVVVVGHVAPPPARLYEFSTAASGPIRQNLDLAAYGREIGVRLAPVSVVQDASPEPGDGLLRQWPRPAVDVHKHYGYAFQWLALGALMAGLYVWFQLVRPRLRRSA
jgi:surfeit locus 1 family protein